MTGPRAPEEWGVEGPVREIFMVWLNGDRLELTGPDGATPWIVQLDDAEHPVEVVERIVTGLVGPPMLLSASTTEPSDTPPHRSPRHGSRVGDGGPRPPRRRA